MAQYHLRVAEKELHVRSPGGECSIPLDTSLTSKTLNNVIAHVDTDEGTDVTFQAGVLETWAAQLRCGEPRDLHLPGYGYFSGVYQGALPSVLPCSRWFEFRYISQISNRLCTCMSYDRSRIGASSQVKGHEAIVLRPHTQSLRICLCRIG